MIRGSGGDVPLEVKKVEELDKAQRRIHNQQSELKLQTVLLAQQQNEISELKKRLRDSGLHAPDDGSPAYACSTERTDKRFRAVESNAFSEDSVRGIFLRHRFTTLRGGHADTLTAELWWLATRQIGRILAREAPATAQLPIRDCAEMIRTNGLVEILENVEFYLLD